ncbi:MAG TPA: urea ABC transporter substrate-binding protein, partial [Bradyrhizobium sp.]|nr:urea ABC transporter substrate-binding protein [Bradyrhizobium sp.]
MPSHFVRLASALVGVAAASLLASGAWAQDKTPIKLGVAITQTGPYSPPALFELRGYELAVDQIN